MTENLSECEKMWTWMRTLIFSLLQMGQMSGTHAREAKKHERFDS